ncbi:MAG: DUF1549 domain-containing protein [Planctomycetales bacterium]|nr:DUF1549 domain-containing protein [Planctomycetales bacterium]
MKITTWNCVLACTILWGMTTVGNADDASVPYIQAVKPILKSRCYACHGALKQESELRLDTGPSILKGGNSGPAVVAGMPDVSELLTRVTSADLTTRMPPEGAALTAAEIAQIREWIELGAKGSAAELPDLEPGQHWAFQQPLRPKLPTRANGQVSRNPVDAFLFEKLDTAGIEPSPRAHKATLLRRVTLDLIGLPPTRDELRAFLADESENAYGVVVERLLNDARHGERWGRHWMDVWRYSDWYGRRDVNDVRNSASQLYRWRDWIVRSLNQGMGYDQMVREMLAADEISPEDYEAGVATGYLIRNYYSLNSNDWMRSAVEHTGKAFLGLTFNCAHCHDHKYDPITHTDYFRMRAFFEPLFVRQDRVPGEADPGIFQDYAYSGTRAVQRLGTVRVFDKSGDAPTWFYTGGDERNRVQTRGSIPPGVPLFLENAAFRIEPVNLPPRAWYPGLRPEIQATMLSAAQTALKHAESDRELAETSGAVIPEALREQVVIAEHEFETAFHESEKAGTTGALAGKQSLVLDATTGRSIVQNTLPQLKSFDDGARLAFRLRILQDAHVNFQFVKDSVQGLTAGYVAFDRGRIMAYLHGTLGESEIGRYDFLAGQNDFEISVVLRPEMDLGQLTIMSRSDNSLLVQNVSVALNGWNPVGTSNKPLSFDARVGSVAVLDDFLWSVPLADQAAAHEPWTTLIKVDFEAPLYVAGKDVVGIDGWEASSFRVNPATSLVSASIGNAQLQTLSLKLQTARRAVRGPQLQLEAAEARVVATRGGQAALEARIAADVGKYVKNLGNDVQTLIQRASQLEREAALHIATADVLAAEFAIAVAEAKAPEDAERATELATANAGLTAARTAQVTANAALANKDLSTTYAPLTPSYPQQSTGRRRALAEWITSRDNPLTARVAVNHLWTRHFHAPLVSSMYDFGRNGGKPTHPELLDWLAVELMESGWDMKHLHRLFVTSDAYCRESKTSFHVQPQAADNHLYWRRNTSRMESEVVRDSLLYVAGRLDLTQGGVELENKDALTTNRRSLYYSIYPESGGKSSLGELFDAPDPLDCYRRVSSIVPQQALALTNSDLTHESSVAIVKAWQESEQQATEPFIVAMFEQILSRLPTPAEERVCRDALARQQTLATNPDSGATLTESRESLVRILLNHNDFLTIR